MARQVTVQITGDSRQFKTATEEANSAAGKFGSVMQGIAQGIGQGIFNLAVQGLHDIVQAVKDSDQAFRDDQASLERFKQQLTDSVKGFDGNTTAVERFVAAQAKLGFNAITVRDALGKMVGVTGDVATAQIDLSLAEDLARAKGLDLTTASDDVTKALEGNYKAFKTLGITIPAHATQAQALAAIYANVKGQAEGYANTSQGKLEAAQAINTASWVKIGAIVDRVSSVVLPAVANAFAAVADWVTAHGVPIFNQIRAVVEQIAKAFIGLLAPALQYIRDHFDQLKPVLVVIGAVALIALGLIVGAILVVIATVVLLVAGIAFFVQKWEEHWAQAQTDWTNFENTVIGGVRRVIGVLNEIPGVHINLPQLQGLGGTAQLGTHSGGLQSFASGGVVQGVGPQLVIAHGGETITPAGQSRNVTININNPIGGDGPYWDKVANQIAQRLTYTTGR